MYANAEDASLPDAGAQPVKTYGVYLLIGLAVLLMLMAFGEQTFRAWTYGQASVACLLLALIIK